ncbi:penicillin-binding protein activator [Pararhodobacter sp. SW119]|uniref:penicillin-binding protein activator n=1 Tax=Pararhodobacter sp. SW119 TaxID=2780075 RepID=UPI001AE0740A|nr:penicillin-binding protein activator [Pararhodobacter sp. SW119]
MSAVLSLVRFLGKSAPLRGLIALTGIFTLAACEPTAFGSVGGAPRVDPGAPVQVALLVPSGSGSSGDAVLAESLENAARLATRDLSGVRIDLRVYSTAGAPGQAAQVAARAVDEGAQIILGPVYGREARPAGNAVAGRGVNVLSFSNDTSVAGGNVFVMGLTFENTARRLMNYAANQGRGQVMVVAERTDAGRAAIDAARRAAPGSGASVVAVETFDFSQQGVVEALPRLSQTARGSGAQTVLFSSDTAGALPLLVQLLPDNRVGPPQFQFMGLTRWDIPPSSLQMSGLQGGWFAKPDPALTAQFEQRYRAAYGSNPHPIAALAYDGMAAIGALVSTGRSDAFSRTALTQGSGFAGVNGVFRLLPSGGNERALAVATIRDNQVQIIDSAPRSFTGPGF